MQKLRLTYFHIYLELKNVLYDETPGFVALMGKSLTVYKFKSHNPGRFQIMIFKYSQMIKNFIFDSQIVILFVKYAFL